jgi:hypothetical protein
LDPIGPQSSGTSKKPLWSTSNAFDTISALSFHLSHRPADDAKSPTERDEVARGLGLPLLSDAAPEAFLEIDSDDEDWKERLQHTLQSVMLEVESNEASKPGREREWAHFQHTA